MTGKLSLRDFISTTLLKDCSGVFASVIAQLANLSFAKGLFPIQFKTAQVNPIVKKAGLDTSNPASYRPISNLNTISNVLERLFLTRLIPHISPSICLLQSAYRQFHSTDLFKAAESDCFTVLVVIDLSAAFDTIDHQVLVRRLEHTCGVKGPALNLANSYLEGCSCFVKVGNACQLHSALTPVFHKDLSWVHCFFNCLLRHSAMSYQVLA